MGQGVGDCGLDPGPQGDGGMAFVLKLMGHMHQVDPFEAFDDATNGRLTHGNRVHDVAYGRTLVVAHGAQHHKGCSAELGG